MPLTTLDPNTALVVVDLQKGIVSLPAVHPVADVVGRVVSLIEAFRRLRLPVVLVNVAGGAPGRTERPRRMPTVVPADFTELVPELGRGADDIFVTKRSWGAFATTDLEERLKSRGVTQVVVVGVATATGVEATARQAYELGFNVTLAVDAMTDSSAEAHEYSLGNVFPRIGETGTSGDVLALLAGRKV